jgi:Holliday junction DNA helicase RuvA
MIGRLSGTVADRGADWVIIDAGVGYHLSCTASTMGAIPSAGGEAVLFVHTHVRENEITLFGFATKVEKELFLRLIAVSDIGPRKAAAILSGTTPPELIKALSDGNTAYLTSLQGIGRKTAERLVVEMKDRLSGLDVPSAPAAAGQSLRSELLAVLSSLGYRSAQAERAVDALQGRLDGKVPLENLIREALAEIKNIG